MEKFGVDVGKTLGTLMLASAVTALYQMVFGLLFGQLHILDLTGPIGLIWGIALWRHAPSARDWAIAITWLVVAFLIIMLFVATIFGTTNMAITAGGIRIQDPAIWQVYLTGLLVAPLIWLLLLVLHSDKAEEEFKKSPAPEATPMTSAKS